jgi:Kef-type K+ transport system membrane component KefB
VADLYLELVPVVVVSAAVPIAVGLMPARHRLPQVVLLLAAGVLIGPEVLDLSSPGAVTLISDLGMGFLFLLAGYELDPALMRGAEGRLAGASWLLSLALAGGLTGLLFWAGVVESPLAVAIALTTTALGVLVPILKEEGLFGTTLGRHVFAGGTVGELGPIVAMALFLGSRHTGAALLLLGVFAVLVVQLAFLPSRLSLPRTTAVLLRSEHGTGQSTLRVTIVLLVGLLALSSSFGFDAVLGAFLAGMVLRRWAPGDVEALEGKLDVMGWGFFIPVFFVSSGMNLDIDAILEQPLLPVLLLALMLLIRGGPALFWYRRALGTARERIQLGLFTSTALPMLVALTELAVARGEMKGETAAALVGAGAMSVLVFPYAARVLQRGAQPPPPEPGEPVSSAEADRPPPP